MITFKPIALSRHKDVTLKFREDSYVASFGNADLFYKQNGARGETYFEWLEAKLSADPEFAVHVWRDDEIIGQMELGLLKSDATCGYVNLYYLALEARGTGVSADLDQYAVDIFRRRGLKRMRLSVSPTNFRALAYYVKMGWRDLGPRADAPEVHFMEKSI